MYKSKLIKALDVLDKDYREAILNEDNDLIIAIQNQQSAYMITLRLLDNEPTAYDVDKVVKELEERKALHERLVDYETKNGTVTEKYQHIKAIDVLNDAIEIVKQGSVSDDVCEWKADCHLENDNPAEWLICPHNPKRIFSTDIKYCPYCGKKIKEKESD